MITLQELAPFLTFLSDGREWRWFPFLSFFSGVQTPGSVWVERSDSTDSLVLLFQSDVPLWCSVSLLGGKTKVSSSEPDQKKIIIIIILETFYWQKTVCALRTVYEEERTHSSCCPWFLNQVRGCMDRTRSCFCVSSSTQYPPDLYSVCGSLSHSLEDRENVKLLKHYHFKDSFTQIKKTFCGLSRVIRPLFLEQHSLFQCWRVIL